MSKNYIYDNHSWDCYLSERGVNTFWAVHFQKMWANNWLRTVLSIVVMWSLSAVCVYLVGNVLRDDNMSLGLIAFVSFGSVLLMFTSPEIFVSYESFLYKWKAKKLCNLYLKNENIVISKDSIKNNELEVYESLKSLITELSVRHNLNELWSNKWKKIIPDWDVELSKCWGGALKTALYYKEDFGDKNYTVRSRNDIARLLGSVKFDKRLDRVFVNRQCSASEVKRLMNDFFFALLVKEELSLRYNYAVAMEMREKHMSHGLTIVV